MQEIPQSWLVCPVTKEALELKNGKLISTMGEYKKEAGQYWDFIPYDLQDLNTSAWQTWQQLQDNGNVMYTSDPENNLGVGKRKDFLQFRDFCRFDGLILDVGVGPQKSPTHIAYCENQSAQFIGIDPLSGEQPRSFGFVKGLGEYLPFCDNLFDQIIFVTSLDHFIDPTLPLLEARRALKPTGSIYIWIGEKAADAPKPTESNPLYDQLKVPEGAQDRFHYKRFNTAEFESFLNNTNLKIQEKEMYKINEWRKNLFYRVMK